jgi:heat shock protein HslJ
MRPVIAIAVAGLLLGVFAGCASEPQDPGLQPADPFAAKDHALRGQTFVTTTVTVNDEPRHLVDGTQALIGFTDEGITLEAGCNQMSGRAAYADGVLRVDGMGGTEMGCDPPRMDQDAWLAGFLTDDPRYALDGETLTLTDGNTEITLEPEAAQPQAALVGTRWRLDGIIEGSGPGAAVSTVPGGLRPVLRLTRAGQLGAQLGCNQGGGAVEVDADTLHLAEFPSTLMACRPGPRSELEHLVTRVLGTGDIGYTLDGQTLTLTRGQHGLVYSAAD